MSSGMKHGWVLATAAIALVVSSVALAQSALPRLLNLSGANTTETTSPAEVVLSRVHFQRSRGLICNAIGTCAGSFAAPAAKQRLELHNVSCFAQLASGNTAFAVMQYQSSSTSSFPLPLSLTAQSTVLGETLITLQQQTSMFVPAKIALLASVMFTGPDASANCQIFGDLVTLK